MLNQGALTLANVTWLLAAMAFVIAPHAMRLPIWVSVTCAGAGGARWWIARHAMRTPPWWIMAVLAFLNGMFVARFLREPPKEISFAKRPINEGVDNRGDETASAKPLGTFDERVCTCLSLWLTRTVPVEPGLRIQILDKDDERLSATAVVRPWAG